MEISQGIQRFDRFNYLFGCQYGYRCAFDIETVCGTSMCIQFGESDHRILMDILEFRNHLHLVGCKILLHLSSEHIGGKLSDVQDIGIEACGGSRGIEGTS